MAKRPEQVIALCGLDAATQAAIQSDEEEFYGLNESSDSSESENENEESGNEESENEEELTEFDPNLSQEDIESRARLASTGRVSRTESGNAVGVFMPVNDPLYDHVRKTLQSKACCEANCLAAFDLNEVYQFQLNLLEMTKEQKSMLILGKLHVLSRAGEPTAHARKRGGKRQRITYNYAFDHREVCKKAFQFLHDIGEKQLKNMVKHLKVNGPVPIVHGNTGKVPPTVYPFEVVQDVVHFIRNHAEVHGLPQPSARRGRADMPPIYLPASQNFKIVHDFYVKAVTEGDPSQHIMQYRSLVDVWHKCIPEVQFMTPRTDVCAICERYRNNIKAATSEQEKISLLSSPTTSVKHRQNVSTTWTAAKHLNYLLVHHPNMHTTLLILLNSYTYPIIPVRWDLYTSR